MLGGTIAWIGFAASFTFHPYWVMALMDDILPTFIFIAIAWYFSNGELKKLFRRPRWSDWWFAVVMLIVQVAYSLFAIYSLNSAGFSTNENGEAAQVGSAANKGLMLFHEVISDLFDLMSEEVVSLTIFLVVAALLIQYYHFSRRSGLGIAMLASMILFGLIHFETYNWNLVQMLLVIGVARFFLNSIFVRSKSIWVSYIVHNIFDALSFLIAMNAMH